MIGLMIGLLGGTVCGIINYIKEQKKSKKTIDK